MKMTRRRFLHGLAVVMQPPVGEVNAASQPISSNEPSKRSVINLGFMEDNSYPFINHYLAGDASTGPAGSAFSTGTPWTALVDFNGWPNQPGVSGKSFGGSVRIAGSDEYSGKWVITWDGDGRVDLGSGTWSVDAKSSSHYFENRNGRYQNAKFGVGSSPRIVVILSGATGPKLVSVEFHLTDPNGIGAYLKNFKFYRLDDEADYLAGKIFRSAYKRSLVNLNPSAIRFMNWHGGSAAKVCRFESRSLPSIAGYSDFCNWVASPSYPAVTGTNIYSVGVSVPTSSNPKTTPASLTHGEVATVRFTNASVRSGQYTVAAVSNANPGVVTTATAHGLNTGDQVVHFQLVGMNQLNYFPVTVTVIDTTHYSIGVDTTSYGAFTSGVGTQYWSIDVGRRGARPIMWVTGSQPGSVFGNYISAGGYAALVYDKNVAGLGDGAGNLSYGAWLFQGAGNGGAWGPGVPIELMTALVNEVNAMSVAQGIKTPVNMWLNIPHTGLTSMDPDYSTASDYALNAVDVITNPASVQRASGYSALTANAKLFIEYSNETWNSAGGFWAFYYLTRMGFLRWPSSGTTNAVDIYALRSTIVMRTIKATYGTASIKYILAGFGPGGYAFGDLNQSRVMGSTTPGIAGYWYTTDTLTVNGGFGRPIDNHDMFATATYFDASSTYYTATGTGSFTDDSALYAGASPYSSPNQAQALTNFVAAVKSNGIDAFLNNSLSGFTATYAAAMQALGKVAINYEGGTDWSNQAGAQTQGGHTITSADNTFLIAAINSSQWGAAQVNYFNRTSQLAGSAMPAVYLFIGANGNQRWAYCNPDSYGGTTTEGQGLLRNPAWTEMSSRNRALS